MKLFVITSFVYGDSQDENSSGHTEIHGIYTSEYDANIDMGKLRNGKYKDWYKIVVIEANTISDENII